MILGKMIEKTTFKNADFHSPSAAVADILFIPASIQAKTIEVIIVMMISMTISRYSESFINLGI